MFLKRDVMIKPLIVAVLFTLSISVWANVEYLVEPTEDNEGIAFVHGEWKEIIELAQKENKLIFMDCYTSWCGPCKMLAKNVFPQKEIGDYFNEMFISVKYDMEKEVSKELAEQLNVTLYPTLLILNAQGEEVDRILGYRNAEVLINWAKDVKGGKTLSALQAKYEKGERDNKFVLDYIYRLMSVGDDEISTKVVNSYFKELAPEAYSEDKNWMLIKYFFNDPYSMEIRYVNQYENQFSEKFGKEQVIEKLETTFYNHAESFISKVNDVYSFDYEEMKSFKQYMQRNKIVVTESVTTKIESNVAARENKWDLFSKLVGNSINTNADFVDAKLMCDWTYRVIASCSDETVQNTMSKWMSDAIQKEDDPVWKERLQMVHAQLIEKINQY